MKILILGATGRTGRLVLEEALHRGHVVHILVRYREKLTKMMYNHKIGRLKIK